MTNKDYTEDSATKPAGEILYKAQDGVAGRETSAMQKYQDMVVGSRSIWTLIKFELIMLTTCSIPGALGLVLRSKLYPLILGKVGRGVVFGRNVTLRHPHKIKLGDGVIIDDNVMLDAKGVTNEGIIVERNCFIGRNSILSCKNGTIKLGESANIGFNAQVYSSNLVSIGPDTLISAYCYVVGGGNYDPERTDVTINRSLREDRAKGINLEGNIWIGTHSVLRDGADIGAGTVVAAGSVVNAPMPGWSIVGGTPAKVIARRPEVEIDSTDT